MRNGRYEILHVEDDQNRFRNYSRMVRGALEEKGIPHEIVWANTLNAAYRRVCEMRDELDLILLDIAMNDPDGDTGLTWARTIQEDQKKLPIFVVSANIGRYHETLEQYKSAQMILGYSEPLEDTWADQLPDILLGKNVSVLHLSDIHNGKFFAYEGLVMNQQAVLDNLCRKLGHVDIVVVSGDLSSINSGDDYAAAAGLLGSLREKLSLTVKDFVFVPGNHDRDRARCDSHTFSQYLSFSEKFYNGAGQPDSYYPSHELEDYDTAGQTFSELFSVVVYPAHRTIVVGFNSVNPLDVEENRKTACPVTEDGTACGLVRGGSVSSQQLANVDRRLKYLYDRCPEYRDFVKIAAFHHNLFEPAHVEELPWRPTLMNQGNLLSLLADHRFLFALHGHLHYKKVYCYKDYDKQYGLNVISTGTFSGKERMMDTDFCANKITYRVTARGEAVFRRLCQLTLPRDGTDWQTHDIILD